ncbi:hypothetical protein LDENG_00162110, partial [Lucifuga dentata]
SFRLSLQGSPQRIICLHLTLSSASSSLTPTNFMSSFTTSINLLFGLPLGLLPGSSNLSIHARTRSASHISGVSFCCYTSELSNFHNLLLLLLLFL